MTLVKEVLPACACRDAWQVRIMACVLVALCCVIADALTRIA